MITGSGLIASAFAPGFAHNDKVHIYAAGVSNSGCTNLAEFSREHDRLVAALQKQAKVETFVYFGTCSVADPDAAGTAYVQHKLAMEALVQAHSGHMILRLPQVAGKTPNPHTLLNFLYARISRSERFQLWVNARRNIIAIDDVVAITRQLLAGDKGKATILNVANVHNYPMASIVAAMENHLGKKAVYDELARGSEYKIDVAALDSVLRNVAIDFGDDYLDKVIARYYDTLAYLGENDSE